MEEEISLKEILISIWQGKYLIITMTAGAIIIALLVSFVFITPLYEASAWVDLTPYKMEELKVKEITGDWDWIESALEDMEENPNLLINNVTFPEVYSNWVLIKVRIADKSLAESLVKKIGVGLFLRVGEAQLDQLKREKAQIETDLEAVEQQMAAFCDDYCESYYQKLDIKKEIFESKINLLADYIYEQFGELDLEQQQFLLETDPTYMVLSEKQRQLLSDKVEIELLKSRIKQGILFEADLIGEPVYEYLVEKQNNLLVDLHNTVYTIKQLEEQDSLEEVEQYIYAESVSGEPINRNWRLNAVLAALLGLMLSVLIVFVRPSLGGFVASVRRAEDDEK
jgi:chain length determinant protein (polysaccharide antigen chain regulator)